MTDSHTSQRLLNILVFAIFGHLNLSFKSRCTLYTTCSSATSVVFIAFRSQGSIYLFVSKSVIQGSASDITHSHNEKKKPLNITITLLNNYQDAVHVGKHSQFCLACPDALGRMLYNTLYSAYTTHIILRRHFLRSNLLQTVLECQASR